VFLDFFFIIITFAKAGVFYPAFVCLFVCLLATSCKNYTDRIFMKIFSTRNVRISIDREFEFYEFFSFLKFNEFYEFFSVEKIRKKFVILLIIDV